MDIELQSECACHIACDRLADYFHKNRLNDYIYQTPPAAWLLSKTVTSIPTAKRWPAVTTPLIPAPMTATRLDLSLMIIVSLYEKEKREIWGSSSELTF
jgi:hypothetical protein